MSSDSRYQCRKSGDDVDVLESRKIARPAAKRVSVCLALGGQNVLHAPNRSGVLAAWQSAAIEVSCILKSRLKHRPSSKALGEQLARWLVASDRTNGRALRAPADATGRQLEARREADDTAASGWTSWRQIKKRATVCRRRGRLMFVFLVVVPAGKGELEARLVVAPISDGDD